MNPGKMIAFTIVFDRQLPIGIKLQAERTFVAAGMQGLIKFGPARLQVCGVIVKLRCIAGQIDEKDIAPDMAANGKQPQGAAINILVDILSRPAHMGGGFQGAVMIVTPGMIGTADRATQPALFLHQDHATVAAGVLENPHHAVASMHHQQGLPKQINGHGIAGFRHILAKTDRRPVPKEDGCFFLLEQVRVHIEFIGKTLRLMDGSHDTLQINRLNKTHHTLHENAFCLHS